MPLGVEQVTRGWLSRARRGLFAGKKVLSGNRVSEDGGNRWASPVQPGSYLPHLISFSVVLCVEEFSLTTTGQNCRTRRKWKPNVHPQALYSETLERIVRLNVTTTALR